MKSKEKLKLECFAMQDEILRTFVEIISFPNTPRKKLALEETLTQVQQIHEHWKDKVSYIVQPDQNPPLRDALASVTHLHPCSL